MSGHCGKCGHTICICEELAERFTHDATCPCYECITIRLAAANEDVERLTWEIDRTRSSMGIRIGDLHSENEQLTARLAAAEARCENLTTEREHMRIGLLCLSMRIVLQQYNLVFQDGDWWLMRSDGEGLVHAALLVDLIIELGKKALIGGNHG